MKLNIKSLIITALLCCVLIFPAFISGNCFTVLVGKDASADGSVLFGHNEQNGGRRIINYWYVPRMKYPPGTEVVLKNGGILSQVEETYAFMWLQNPEVEFGDSYFNEWGVAVSSDACPTREDSYKALVERGGITDGGIGYMLRRLVAQRAKTAREGVRIAGDLLNQFGYTSSGRSLIIADPNEAWVLGIARGKHWIAQRCPDNQVVLLPNIHIIGPEADLNDTKNVIASPGLVEYAVERGWYDPAAGKPFSFKDVYGIPPRKNSFRGKYGVDPRQWYAQGIVKGNPIDLENTDSLPFSIPPEKKMTVRSVAAILRSHAEGTEFDASKHYEAGSPHKIRSPGVICGPTTQEGAVYQLRNWMPADIGCVAWRALAAPCTSVMTPWYLGMTKSPDRYHKSGKVQEELDIIKHFNYPEERFEFDPELAFDVFNSLENLINEDYKRTIKRVREKWDSFEQRQFAVQDAVEETALKLYQQNPELAAAFITEYSLARAALALTQAEELVQQLKKMFWRY